MPPSAIARSVAQHHVARRRRRRCARARAAGTAARTAAGTSARRRSRRGARSNACAELRDRLRRARRRRARSSRRGLLRSPCSCVGQRFGRLRRPCRARRCQTRAISLQDVDEPGPAPLRRRREVGAAVERLQVRRQPDAHRPAAGSGRRLHERHVDAIDVGPLLAIDFDRDEVLVEHARRSSSFSNDSCSITWHQWQVE